MKTSRLEAFSDGVLAIVITIMVLEFKVPEQASFEGLIGNVPLFVSYVLSFVYIGIYWNNHHHYFQISEQVNGRVLWSNLHLLFWLSMIPFASAWIGENYLSTAPAVFYGFVLLMSAVAFNLLVNSLLASHDDGFVLRNAVGNRWKEKISMLIYAIGIGLSFYSSFAGMFCYLFVAVMWFIPDSRIEKLTTTGHID